MGQALRISVMGATQGHVLATRNPRSDLRSQGSFHPLEAERKTVGIELNLSQRTYRLSLLNMRSPIISSSIPVLGAGYQFGMPIMAPFHHVSQHVE